MLVLSADERPYDRWRSQYVDSDSFRVRYRYLALTVYKNSGEITLSKTDKKGMINCEGR